MSGNNQSPIEDGRSPVGGPPRREMGIGTKFGIMALAGVAVLGFIWFNALYSHRAKTQPTVAQTAYGSGGEQYVLSLIHILLRRCGDDDYFWPIIRLVRDE